MRTDVLFGGKAGHVAIKLVGFTRMLVGVAAVSGREERVAEHAKRAYALVAAFCTASAKPAVMPSRPRFEMSS